MFKKTHILEVLRDIESKLTKKNIAIYGKKYYNKVCSLILSNLNSKSVKATVKYMIEMY